MQTDLRDPASIKNLVKETLRAYRRIDILVHNAGIYPDAMIKTMSVELWDEVMAVNLRSAFLLTKAVAPAMVKQKKGRILITSSVTGPTVGFPALSHYGASKGGVNAFAKCAALEYAKHGITVNTVSPGTILTESVAALLGPKGVKETAKAIPAGGVGKVEDIAHAMLFFASDEAEFITGRDLVVDGGQVLPESSEASQVAAIGSALFSEHWVSVEVAGTLLLVAMVGAIVISVQRKSDPSTPDSVHLRKTWIDN